ncbi:class F sortase [Kitasatospora sp. RB6PN24]|uniref:class F sortase n=1 Tax=Kitasatospora humi TaxID=2893891 RepID=UPI001E5F7903|nr:class F sortase [Kitasatospora humi]MCC9307598.1 class F sortase [Kitasatospora humi]
MSRPDRRTRRRRPGQLTVATAAAALLCGVWLIKAGATTAHPPQPEPSAGPPAAAAGVAPQAAPGPALAPSPPVRLRIPAIAVNARVAPVTVDGAGQLGTPPTGRHDLTGWYQDGASPGARGVAVIVGHVDDQRGPSVFYLLGRLRPGRTISVTRADEHTATFTVDSVRSYPKAAFPSRQVYAPTGRAELRLITCGGQYDHRTGYQSNIVVSAHLTSTR